MNEYEFEKRVEAYTEASLALMRHAIRAGHADCKERQCPEYLALEKTVDRLMELRPDCQPQHT